MTKDEALKLALEALEVANSCVDGYYIPKGRTQLPEIELAITAIKEALAQREQDGQCKRCKDGCPACDVRKLPEQEPVAWRAKNFYENQEGWFYAEWHQNGLTPQVAELLYITPPQRTWVGLTKEERHEISMANRPYVADAMAAHEEELKRRNT